jgi:hypothetical protein
MGLVVVTRPITPTTFDPTAAQGDMKVHGRQRDRQTNGLPPGADADERRTSKRGRRGSYTQLPTEMAMMMQQHGHKNTHTTPQDRQL